MLIILVGASATGKTEVGKILKSKYGYNKIVTYTTRDIRIGETKDIDYHFVTKEEFEKMAKEGKFFEYTAYNDNYYGTSFESLYHNGYLILEPIGYNKYFKSNIKYKSFYLNTSNEIKYQRMIQRGDGEEQALKRIRIDNELFNDEIKEKFDFVIRTDNLSIEETADLIISYLKEE